jgi:hypothetical protein
MGCLPDQVMTQSLSFFLIACKSVLLYVKGTSLTRIMLARRQLLAKCKQLLPSEGPSNCTFAKL